MVFDMRYERNRQFNEHLGYVRYERSIKSRRSEILGEGIIKLGHLVASSWRFKYLYIAVQNLLRLQCSSDPPREP
jgi:hypothetical protein